MEYTALVKRLDPHIEEEVTLDINGIEFTGFAFICPYAIEEGKEYPVTLGFTVLNELNVHEIKEEKKELKRNGNGYEYTIRGILKEDAIDAGILILDEDEYFDSFPNLKGKYAEMKVDRISIEFLSK